MPELAVAFDVICPWCWVGWRQAARLRQEFSTLTFRWVGYELLPEGLPYTPAPPDPDAAKKPRIPSRLDLLLAAEGLTLPKRTRGLSNSRLALEGAEFAHDAGKADAYLDALYYAYWEGDQDISDKAVLTEIAEQAGLDIAEFINALEIQVYHDRVIQYDDPAHEAGVWNVPTWMFPGEWVAEQPYSVLHEQISAFIVQAGE